MLLHDISCRGIQGYAVICINSCRGINTYLHFGKLMRHMLYVVYGLTHVVEYTNSCRGIH